MKRTVEVYISTHYAGNLHQTFNLQLNLILEQGYKSYHYNLNYYFPQVNAIRFHFWKTIILHKNTKIIRRKGTQMEAFVNISYVKKHLT